MRNAEHEEFELEVDGVRGRWSDRRWWSDDGVHPNDDGYRVWGEHIGRGILHHAGLDD